MSGIVGQSMNANPEKGMNQRELYKRFSHNLFWTTFDLLHIGQRGGGVALVTEKAGKKELNIKREKGILGNILRDGISKKNSLLGMGFSNDGYFPEPYKVSSQYCNGFPEFVICFSGKLINRIELVEELISKGQIKENRKYEKYDDARLVARLFVSVGWRKEQNQESNFLRSFNFLAQKVKGTCVLGLLTKDAFYGYRDPYGRDFLIIGQADGLSIAASEDIGFHNQKIERVRLVKGGETICLKNGEFYSLGIAETGIKPKICSFKSTYYSAVSTQIFNKSVGYDRMAMGAALARRDIKNGFFPDFAMPILFSGQYIWLGYMEEFIRQRNLGLIPKAPRPVALDRYPLALRSFLSPELEERKVIADQKQIPLTASQEKQKEYENSTVAVLDDSRVSGLQFQSNLIPKIVDMGFKRENIHARIGNPILCTSCIWGKAGRSRNGLIGYDSEKRRPRTAVEIAKLDGIGSILFNTRNDHAAAIGMPLEEMCTECSDPDLNF